MYRMILSLLVLSFSLIVTAQNVGIGTSTPNASAVLDASSTTQGFLPPRMTYAQRNAIVNPAAGLIIYCTDCAFNGEMQYFNGTSWINMSVGNASAPFTLPLLVTYTNTNTYSNGTIIGGNIISDGGTSIIARGVCWSTSPNPTVELTTKTFDGIGVGNFVSYITGLTANSTYHIRSYATNALGTAYGNEKIITTPSPDSLPNVTICNQIWTSRNLDVSTYRNGDPIPQVTDDSIWQTLTSGAYCYYNNDSATYASIYGKLYNWYAVNDPRGLAPIGWHVPTVAEWTTLENCLGGGLVAGGAMKDYGTRLWQFPNTGATNSSGFSGLPGGSRFFDIGGYGGYNASGYEGRWWCSDFAVNWPSNFVLINTENFSFFDGQPKSLGCSVRLLRDTQ